MPDLKMYPVKYPLELLEKLRVESEQKQIKIADLIIQKLENSFNTPLPDVPPVTENNTEPIIFEQHPNA